MREILNRRWRNALRWTGCVIAILGCCAGGLFWYYYHRPLPKPLQKTLFPGVEYERLVLDGPVIGHLVWINLRTAGLEFLVTPSEPQGRFQLKGQTTSAFVERYELSLAINGDFFEPWHSNGPFDYYPHKGDGVNTFGIAASRGDVYSEGCEKPSFFGDAPSIFISEANEITFTRPEVVYNALSGSHWLVNDGKAALQPRCRTETDRHPRSVVGLDRSGNHMGWALIDGRQPNYSSGMTLPELESFLLSHGFHHAVNVDGGGSATLVQGLASGDVTILNSPINHRIPGIERNVANHLGIRVRPVSN